MTAIDRIDHRIPGADGVTLAVREVSSPDAARMPIVLVHGARAGAVASFDLPVSGGSLAADLALAGHRAFVMDARGYGASSRPAGMHEPAEGQAPLVRSVEVVRDIASVVEWVCDVTAVDRVALLGWATGGHWAGYYASLHPERVSRLILYNTLYGGSATHPSLGLGSSLEDPGRPGHFNRSATGGWRSSDAASLLRTWETSVPGDDLDAWRDPAVADAYVAAALTASDRGGDNEMMFAHPGGALEDSFYLATGRQLWDASFIRAHTLVIRSERDFWSRPDDVSTLADQLIDAASVRTVTLADATHYVHLDRPQRGRQQFLDEALSFLDSSD